MLDQLLSTASCTVCRLRCAYTVCVCMYVCMLLRAQGCSEKNQYVEALRESLAKTSKDEL